MRMMILASMLAFLPATAVLAQEQGDKVYTGAITTRWGKAVTPENAWRSYPRPQLQRDKWLNLNGLWDYAIVKAGAPQPQTMQGKILVPFPVESRLSGVARKVLPEDRIWYRREFTVPADWAGQNARLNFGAVDYESVIWVNGAVVGAHKGGSDAFGIDITSALKPGSNEIVVQVADPTSAGSQPRGKQILNPDGIWYTASSGIWQTVWLEPVPKLHIADVRATPNIDTGKVEVDVALSAWANDTDAVRLSVRSGGQVIGSTIVRANRHASIAIPNAHLWSPEDPFLYDLVAELVTVKDPYAGRAERDRAAYDARFTHGEVETYAAAEVSGAPHDTVKAYFAMRKISVGPGTVTGQPMLLLNNKPYFQNGTLDQGWWPDGLLTPPSEEAMRYDLEFLKKAGFNMVRKHIKIEPARYYYDADHMGMLIWQDMPSGGGEDQFVAGTSQSQAVLSSDMMSDQQAELSQMIGDLRAFPSIVMWVVNNEGWGQYDSATLTRFVKGMDPSRLVNSDSGWMDVAPRDSDVFDIHTYEDVPKVPTRQSERAIVIGEYGGVGRPIEGHLWRAGKRNWSYQVAKDSDDYLVRYRRKFEEVVRQAKVHGLSASVYTQTTDVEGEINGLLTYDRAVAKAPAEAFATMARPLWEKPGDPISPPSVP
ncbi:glycoside hydrolase family 2 [Sphingomonas psychrotolerans]|uniref:Glycoside hydrolase family 2 n=1 Tax=Sphingomonas psychrotolerans TaxID=1327635 RepID=A0ABU3N191_9SPHN|nr:sugar-binding domain-containing protein [Sphingomonas psychrotolerans]MDT8758307.1 glycoside hydrolase family 2 [Sphingomonas psychrotolerans]